MNRQTREENNVNIRKEYTNFGILPEDIKEFQRITLELYGRHLTDDEAEDQILRFIALEDLYKKYQQKHKARLENNQLKDNNGG